MRSLLLLCFTFVFHHVCISQTVIQITDNTLIPEGIAIDPRNGNIYISSIAKQKIIKVNSNKITSDFIKEGEHDFLEGLGMKVDTKTNTLWCLSNKATGKWFTSQIHGFDLDSRKVKYHHSFKDTIPHLLNDLVLDNDGNLIITDTYFSSLYKFYPYTNKLDLLLKTPQIKYPNGLAFGKNKILYVASYGTGLLKIDLNAKTIKPLKGFSDSLIAFGLDGLMYKDGLLYGVYNAGKGKETDAVIKYTLDENSGRVLSENIIDKGNAHFFDPTTAGIYKNKLYVIANSHLDQFNKIKNLLRG
ncbi:MAG TPA: SMP-30/gluconolactonase/LRE family protein [Segetibacter sp.]|jgi:sugar lactone lactonase YvrE